MSERSVPNKPWYCIAVIALVPLFLSVAACDESNPTEPVIEEPEEVPRVTETFDGTVALGGRSSHVFQATNAGQLEMTLTALSPLETLTVGLAFGQPTDPANPATCVPASQDTSVRLGDDLVATVPAAGSFCVTVLDVGNIFAGVVVSYTLSVTHP